MYEFRQAIAATQAFKNICTVNADVIKAHTYLQWFKWFNKGD